jgi:hypothetical protein
MQTTKVTVNLSLPFEAIIEMMRSHSELWDGIEVAEVRRIIEKT